MEPTPWEMVPIFAIVFSFATAITIIIVIARARTRRLQMQVDLQSKLIEKFGSSAELVEFLNSRAGQDFVRGVQTAPGRVARERAAGGVRVGIFFSAVGLAFLVLWPISGAWGLAWPGVFLLVIGLGFFASSYSLLRFSREHDDHMPTPAEPPALR